MTNVLSRPLPRSVATLSLKNEVSFREENVFAVQRLKRDNLLIKNGVVVPEKELSLQSKYSFTALYVTEYAKLSTGIFSVKLLTTREKML